MYDGRYDAELAELREKLMTEIVSLIEPELQEKLFGAIQDTMNSTHLNEAVKKMQLGEKKEWRFMRCPLLKDNPASADDLPIGAEMPEYHFTGDQKAYPSLFDMHRNFLMDSRSDAVRSCGKLFAQMPIYKAILNALLKNQPSPFLAMPEKHIHCAHLLAMLDEKYFSQYEALFNKCYRKLPPAPVALPSDQTKKCPLEFAIKAGCFKAIENSLLQKNRDLSFHYQLAKERSPDLARYILLYFTKLAISKDGFFEACNLDFPEIIPLLKELGADLEAVNIKGQTPIAVAIENKQQKVAVQLLMLNPVITLKQASELQEMGVDALKILREQQQKLLQENERLRKEMAISTIQAEPARSPRP